jgi:hypothetical protein
MFDPYPAGDAADHMLTAGVERWTYKRSGAKATQNAFDNCTSGAMREKYQETDTLTYTVSPFAVVKAIDIERKKYCKIKYLHCKAGMAKLADAADLYGKMETPYTVKEVARLTGFSVQTIIRIFSGERGVIVFEEKWPRKRASYRTIRIPRHVYRRVMQKWTVQ